MSVSLVPKPTDEPQDQPAEPDANNSLHPEDVFDHEVFHDPEICSACFQARVRVDGVRCQDGIPATDGYLPDDQTGRLESWHTRTTCDRCGSIGARSPTHSLNKLEALQRATALADVLEAKNHRLDRRQLRRAVRKGKEREGLQGHDTEIFRFATQYAIQAARSDDR